RNALLALLDQPGATLADVLRLLDDRAFRQEAASRVANRRVRDFWLREYEGYPRNFRAEAIAPIQNKVGAFLSHPVLHNIVTQPRSAFDLRRAMDEGKVLLESRERQDRRRHGSAAWRDARLPHRAYALTHGEAPESTRRD